MEEPVFLCPYLAVPLLYRVVQLSLFPYLVHRVLPGLVLLDFVLQVLLGLVLQVLLGLVLQVLLGLVLQVLLGLVLQVRLGLVLQVLLGLVLQVRLGLVLQVLPLLVAVVDSGVMVVVGRVLDLGHFSLPCLDCALR